MHILHDLPIESRTFRKVPEIFIEATIILKPIIIIILKVLIIRRRRKRIIRIKNILFHLFAFKTVMNGRVS